MTTVLPRLARVIAIDLIDGARAIEDVTQLAARLPDETVEVTWPPVGNTRVAPSQLRSLRADILTLGGEHGMPTTLRSASRFDAAVARLLHQQLDISPHEASQDEVWNYVTCCWLLDVAMWRFGQQADIRRFIGDLNRNTFRRLWWRAEILGARVDLDQLGEDEMVNIMERPTLASDPWLAQTLASQFLDHVTLNPALPRMQLMRETTKRLLRRTPFIDFAALDDGDLSAQVRAALEASAAALCGDSAADPAPLGPPSKRAPSPEVFVIPRVTLTDETTPFESNENPVRSSRPQLTMLQAALAAADIAARTGRVTNQTLRELLAISSAEARAILQFGVDEGMLGRRGERRGTYYTPVSQLKVIDETDNLEIGTQAGTSGDRDADTVLRRLLRRKR